MTKCEFFTEDDRITGFSVSGHSGYAEAGSDIVCAAISAAVTMAEAIINEALERVYITEVQRRFAYHYHAVDNYNMGGHILEMMQQQDLFPSRILQEGKIEL